MRNEMFVDYRNHLFGIFEPVSSSKVLLLKTGIAMYPLMAEMGIHFDEPIGIIVESGIQAKSICQELAGFSKVSCTSLAMGKKELKDLYFKHEYEVFLVEYYCARQSAENLQYLSALRNLRGSDDNILAVIFCGGMPEELAGCLSGVIYLTAEPNAPKEQSQICDNFTYELIKYIETNQNVIFRNARNDMHTDDFYEKSKQYAGYSFFSVARLVLQMILEDLEQPINIGSYEVSLMDSAFEELLNDFDSLQMADVSWEKQFRELLYRAAEHIPAIIQRERVYASDMNMLQELPLYDEKHYYLPEAMLRDICEPWLCTLSFASIKNALAREGLLVSQGSKRMYFTVKVPVITVYGQMLYVRAMKIPREKIDRVGSLTWCELLLAKGERE